MRWAILIGIVVIAIAAVAAYFWLVQPKGSVTLLVLNSVGERNVTEFSLSSGSTALIAGRDAYAMSLDDVNRIFVLSDGSFITVESAGVVRKDDAGNLALLIASPVAPVKKVPLAVWDDGRRIAWINPADRSLQVFERNSRGVYLPIYLNKDVSGNSLGFTDDGDALVVAQFGLEDTTLTAINLTRGTASKAGTVLGHAAIISDI